MATFKLMVLLCSAILTCYCQETVTKRPTGNSTSQIEKEDALKPIIEKPVQKMANQVAKPEHSSNVNPQGQHQPISQRNPGQDVRQARRLSSQDPSQPSVSYQGQQPSISDPSTYRRPLADRSQPQPAYQNNPSTDPRQRRRLDQDRNQPSYQDESADSQNRDLSRVPYYGRPEAPGDQRRRQYRDPSSVRQDEQTYKPYSFNYIAETEEGMTSHQQAADASGRVSGSYRMTLEDGRKRIVDYIADENGFRANVDTNEPGTSSAENPASVVYSSSGPAFSGHGFQGNTNRLQPQPNQFRLGRDGQRTETRMTSSVSGPFRGTYDRTGSRPLRGQTQFRSGREDVDERDATTDDRSQMNQNQGREIPRSSRDNFQGVPDGTANRVPYGIPPRSDRGYQNRPSRVLPGDSQIPNLSSFGRDDRQSGSYQPAGDRSPLNREPSLYDQNNARGLDGTNRPVQNNPLQPGEFTSPIRNNDINEPSYYGWFRPSFRPREESLRPGYRSQHDSLAPAAQPGEGDISGYQPVIRVENPRGPRQPTWASSRPNSENPSQDAPSQDGRSSPRSMYDPESRARPQYNRNDQVQPDPRVSGLGPQRNLRNNQIAMNIPRSDFERTNPSAGSGSSQSSPDNQRAGGRQEFIIPEAPAATGDMPQGYRNYGTYWYYGN